MKTKNKKTNRDWQRKRVVVAMSGGIDSSVAAALLKRAGFDVIGVFMKLINLPNFKESEKRARKIAKILKIPFYALELEREFKKRIIKYFIAEYKKETPNPCVLCNKEIKFGLLLKKALGLGADFLATGHYVRTKEDKKGIHLLKARDEDKDQSYFLWRLSQKELKRTIFPVGNFTQDEVRSLAEEFRLPVLKVPKSVEICFIRTTINEFLRKNLKENPGPVVEQVHYGVNKIVGQHRGLWFYTIGQRKGIKLTGGPYFVLDKDLKKNTLIVTKNDKDLEKKELIAQKVNWIFGKEPELPLKVESKIRYRHQPAISIITKKKGTEIYHLKFKKGQRAITPGQSVVFYKGSELVGGGIIN